MLKKKDRYIIAVVGATGVVGREIIEIIEERKFPVSDLILLASDNSEGERIEFREKSVVVKRLEKKMFSGVDIALFSAGAETSREFAYAAVDAGALVIDGSSAFSMDQNVPLVVPEVNPNAIERHTGIISSPTSSTISLLVALKPIHDAATIRRVVLTVFHSVSQTGKEAMDELAGQTVALLNFRDIELKVYPYQIAFNCFPHIDAFLDNGDTKEEESITSEVKKILKDDSIHITATAVRVPIFRGLAESINIETADKIRPNEARAVLANAQGVIVYDDPTRNIYPLPIEAAGKDDVYVGRIREDRTISNGLNLWVVSDNVRKGAALNMVQIAELLIR